MINRLDDFRKQIDLIDDQIVNLLNKRMIVVKKIGKWKRKKRIKPFDRVRWQKVLTDKIKKAKKLSINPELVEKIYRAIHEEALKVEEKI